MKRDGMHKKSSREIFPLDINVKAIWSLLGLVSLTAITRRQSLQQNYID